MSNLMPVDTDLEQSLLSSQIDAFGDKVPELLSGVQADDFFTTHHRQIYLALGECHNAGDPIGVHTVASQDAYKESTEELAAWMDRSSRFVPNVGLACEQLVALAQARRTLRAAGRCVERIGQSPLDIPEIVSDAVTELERIRDDAASSSGTQAGHTTVHELMTTDFAADEWVVDGLIRQRGKVMLVAGEGGSKSLTLRQVAMCAAAGVHPFQHTRLKNGPVRVLMVDLENRPHTVAHQVGLITAAFERRGIDIPDVPMWLKPEEIDILERSDRRALEAEIMATRPELMTIGPIYKMYSRFGGSSGGDHESRIQQVTSILEDLQARYGFALLMEHHAPMAQGGKRELRPVDSVTWTRWPEVGLAINPAEPGTSPAEHKLSHFRPPRDPVWWPKTLVYGIGDRPMPWSGRWPDKIANRVLEGGGVPSMAKKPKVAQPAISEEF